MSRLLVDTHALLWWLTDDAGLSATARAALADPANDVLREHGERVGDRDQACARQAQRAR